MAGYQKPNRGTLGESRDIVSSEESMTQDSGIGFSGQGTYAENSRIVLTMLLGYAISAPVSFLVAMIFLRVP